MPSDSDDPSEDAAIDAYDDLAPDYVAELEENPYNAHLSFPATTDLLPDVSGQRVLDAGCGGGAYTEWLLDHGAEAVGIDASEGMLAEARDRLGDRSGVTFRRADLRERLPFEDDSFDGVVSGLALGYVEDWDRLFEEFRRVLRPGGFVVLCTKHPFDEFPLPDDADYFAVERAVKEWDVEVPYYRRPLGAITGPVLDSGFRLEELIEPQPTAAFAEAWPERYETESKRPVFLCLRAVLSDGGV
ncbi:class I SAM-dependent methyltransferase [Haloglomus litoreum]|uniref:class I SAM-dependent methyltransferase n=1 Tax=Haloglomus litoreum TaxID=3034026 RepID=UPI0023E76891|nr:class I SAM-dependent methyltransferase [Haloglomus sp. DT116]